MMTAPYLEIQDIAGRGEAGEGIAGLSLMLAKGAFLALVDTDRASGSALLDLLAGFAPLRRGAIRCEGIDIAARDVDRRGIMSVPRGLALFSRMNAFDNIAFPLRRHGLGRGAMAARVTALAGELGLDGATLRLRARDLSPEAALRVALARALAGEPAILLLDEPLDAIAPPQRPALAAMLKHLHRRFALTSILATRDLPLAMMLADRIDVLEGGRIVQSGLADDIYYRPYDARIANLAGRTNLIPVEIAVEGERFRIAAPLEPATIDLPRERLAPGLESGRGLMLVRPEQVRPSLGIRRFDCTIKGRIEDVFHRGGILEIRLRADGLAQPIACDIPAPPPFPLEIGHDVTLGWNRVDTFILPAGSEA